MRRSVHDDAVGQTVRCKSKGTSKRYAFADYSDKIKLSNKTAKILKDRIKQIKNQKVMHSKVKGYDKLQELAKSMRKVQLVKTHADGGRIRCNMTHVWNGERWSVIGRIMSISEVKSKYPNVQELMYSKNDEVYGDVYMAAANVS